MELAALRARLVLASQSKTFNNQLFFSCLLFCLCCARADSHNGRAIGGNTAPDTAPKLPDNEIKNPFLAAISDVKRPIDTHHNVRLIRNCIVNSS
jgi:hypothetical protein